MPSSSSIDPYECALFILQKVACIPSALGSLMIISQVCRSKFNRKKPQQRLLLGMSVLDLIVSILWTFTNLFMPTDSGALFASGNQASCDAQGTLIQFSNTAGILYMCALQIQYLLVIKYGWKERRIRELEKWFHALPIFFGGATAVAALALKQYNPANWNCWIAPLPQDCTPSHKVNKGMTDLTETDCIRGDNAEIYRWALFYAPLWATIAFVIFVMILIYRSVRETEVNSVKWKLNRKQFDKSAGKIKEESMKKQMQQMSKSDLRLTNEVKTQSVMYALAFFIVWIFPTLGRLIQLVGGTMHPVLGVLSGTFIGSQGIWYSIIYFRPRYKKCVKYKKWYQKVWALVHSTLFFCCYSDDYTKDSKDDYVDAEQCADVLATPGQSTIEPGMKKTYDHGENIIKNDNEGGDRRFHADNADAKVDGVESTGDAVPGPAMGAEVPPEAVAKVDGIESTGAHTNISGHSLRHEGKEEEKWEEPEV